jgi:hypothetical protein
MAGLGRCYRGGLGGTVGGRPGEDETMTTTRYRLITIQRTDRDNSTETYCAVHFAAATYLAGGAHHSVSFGWHEAPHADVHGGEPHGTCDVCHGRLAIRPDGRPTRIDVARIMTLRDEARRHGDERMEVLCNRAAGGEFRDDAAWLECARILAEAESQSEEVR